MKLLGVAPVRVRAQRVYFHVPRNLKDSTIFTFSSLSLTHRFSKTTKCQEVKFVGDLINRENDA